MNSFATVEDVNLLWRSLRNDEEERCEALIQVISDSLRLEAQKAHKDLDAMVQESEIVANVAKSVTVDIVARTLMTSTDHEPMTQMTQSAGGYSVSGSFLVPGGGIFIKDAELKRLGIKRQKIGVISFVD